MPKESVTLPAGIGALFQDYAFSYDLDAPPPEAWPSGDYFGDGSGGRFSSIPSLRRCGIGLAFLVNGVLQFGLRSPLPGDVQTVPRSEVAAAHVLLLHLAPKPLFHSFQITRFL